jgi:hypothetical protein
VTDYSEVLDCVLHALGRPATRELALKPWRDHFCLPVDDPLTNLFAESGYFRRSLLINDAHDAVWKVTEAGKFAAAETLR